MNTKALLFTIGFLGLAVAGYFAYDSFLKNEKALLWDFVPENSIAVYQKGDCNECIDSLSQAAWLVLLREAYLKNHQLDSAFFSEFLKLSGNADAFSLHKTAKHRFDLIFYSSEKNDLLEGIRKYGKSRERNYNGVLIKELATASDVITWVELSNYVVLSLSPILIEDVVRAYQLKSERNFVSKVKQVASLPVVKNDGGDVLVDLEAFSNWLQLFGSEEGSSDVKIKGAALLDVKRTGKSIILNGFSDSDSTQTSSLLNVFKGQSPVAFGLKNFISSDAHFVVNFGFSDPVLLGRNLQTLLGKNRKDLLLRKLGLNDNEVKQFYNGLGKEVGLQSLELSGLNSASILMVDVKSDDSWTGLLDKLAASLSEDTVFVEHYSSHVIKRLDMPGLIELLFPISAFEYDELYFVQSGNVLLMAGDIRLLKKLLDDIEEENVWSKSVDKNRFLESTFLESNISIYVDPLPYSKLLTSKINEEWRPFFVKEDIQISSLGLSAFQFSHLNNNFYTNIYLGFDDVKKKSRINRPKEILVNINSAPIYKFFLVKNHNDKGHEVLVQDSANIIYLLSAKGEILWSKNINGLIRGEVEQIDYYANGKLQMLLGTDKDIHVIDRLGNYVNPYPISTLTGNLFSRSIDYDHSKNYRFITADKSGAISMVSKEGKLLDGWKGMATNGELLVAPKHYRIAARDYIAVVHSVGRFSLYNRRGELLKGFPVDLKGRVRDDFYLEVGNAKEKVAFVFVTMDGQKIRVDLTGTELSRETLIKPVFDTRFRMVTEESEKSYLTVRQNNKSLTLLSKSGAEILSNDFIGMNSANVKYYDFGSGNIYYVVLDVDQDLGYVYNAEGRLITSQPLECQNLKLFLSNSELQAVTSYKGLLKISNLN